MVKRSRDSESVRKTGVRKSKERKEMYTEMHGGSSDPAGTGRVDPQVQSEIGRHLRAIYDDVIKEPVPSKFLELLAKLERSTTRKG